MNGPSLAGRIFEFELADGGVGIEEDVEGSMRASEVVDCMGDGFAGKTGGKRSKKRIRRGCRPLVRPMYVELAFRLFAYFGILRIGCGFG